METWVLKPAPGFNVRKQDGTFLKAEGETVQKNSYYRRRVEEGSAVEVKSTPKTKKRD